MPPNCFLQEPFQAESVLKCVIFRLSIGHKQRHRWRCIGGNKRQLVDRGIVITLIRRLPNQWAYRCTGTEQHQRGGSSRNHLLTHPIAHPPPLSVISTENNLQGSWIG